MQEELTEKNEYLQEMRASLKEREEEVTQLLNVVEQGEAETQALRNSRNSM